jgi:SAM-dependent methyltransferase
MGKFEEKIRGLENYKAIRDYLPNDHSNRQSLAFYVEHTRNQFSNSTTVLDLGCGEGDSIDLFKKIVPKAHWHGVDIEDSPEVRKRIREHGSIKTFDGVNLPYPNNYFDLIYCNQVLEHVRYPDKLISEAFRVLKPYGLFAGAVSYLEPFHSYSIFNFTPYGIIRVFTDAGFKIEEIRPGSDASLFINRQLLNRSTMFRFIWNRNYLHIICDLIGSVFCLGHCERNFLKVQFAGHLCFLAKRPENINN